MALIPRWLRRATADEIMEQQIQDALHEQLMHAASAEHHQALAFMYRNRVARLRAWQSKEVHIVQHDVNDVSYARMMRQFLNGTLSEPNGDEHVAR